MCRVFVVVTMIAGTGCDVAFGLTGNDLPACEPSSFENVVPVQQPLAADRFSYDEARTRAVVDRVGLQYEADAAGEVPIHVGLSAPALNVALSPEGDHAYFTFATEVPAIIAVQRTSRGVWEPEPAPKGSVAGTPTAAMFGSPQMIVRLDAYASPAGYTFQEVRKEGTRWVPIGERHGITNAELPANLSPDGLTMVYAAVTPSAEFPFYDTAVYAAQRSSIDEWFQVPVMLLPPARYAGPPLSPQLSSDCRRLDVVGANPMPTTAFDEYVVFRYER